MAKNATDPSTTNNFFKSRAACGVYGGLMGIAAFGGVLFTSPAVIQAVTYAIAGALASILGASVGVYIGAMAVVALAATFLGAALGCVLHAICNKLKTQPSEVECEEPASLKPA